MFVPGMSELNRLPTWLEIKAATAVVTMKKRPSGARWSENVQSIHALCDRLLNIDISLNIIDTHYSRICSRSLTQSQQFPAVILGIRPGLHRSIARTIGTMRHSLELSLALMLDTLRQRGEELVTFLALAYCLERMTFPLHMSLAKTLFYFECSVHDMARMGGSSTFIGHRLLPIQIPTRNMCAICYGNFVDPVLTTCRHEFCEYCCRRAFAPHNRCPVCRQRPLPWLDTWPFIAAALWSYVCSYYAAKQTTLALSISNLLLAYMSTDCDMFLDIMFVVVFQLSCNTAAHIIYYYGTGRTILCDRTASEGYRAFQLLHLTVSYGSVFLCY
jgi:hypothetical protein